MTGTLVLIRHGEIVRPAYSSNFDRAPLSTWGEAQIRALAQAWPVNRPTAIFASPLRRTIESALLLAQAFSVSITKRLGLREWSADESDIPQPEYKALERRAWADFDFVPPNKESLAQAAIRGRQCIEGIAEEVDGSTVAVVGHGTLLCLVTAALKDERPTEAYKDSIQFASAAIVESGSDLRLVRDFRIYGTPSPPSKNRLTS
jgi:broad specificity phosphatase PhoE